MIVALTGCKTTQQQYHHGNYSEAVYGFFKQDGLSIEQQVTLLEEVIQNAASKNKPVAPGIHAHLGMLFFELGDAVQGLEHFNQEKLLFPESTQYIDFLITSGKGA